MAVHLYSKKKSAFRGPDPVLAKEQLMALLSLYQKLGCEKFCSVAIWILKKKPDAEAGMTLQYSGRWNKKLVPFVWNKMQKAIWVTRARNNIVLKYRQGGTTTWFIIIRLFLPAILEAGTSSLLISQTKHYGAQHFGILQRAFKHFLKKDPFNSTLNTVADQYKQHLLHTQYTGRHELVFDQLDSRVLVDTAENTEVGQGLPGINHLHCTEVARWPHVPEETMANVTESVTPDGTKDIESTPNGMGGFFFEEVQRAKNKKSEYRFHFYPWPFGEEYTIEEEKQRNQYISAWEEATEEENSLKAIFELELGQVAWRRKAIIRLRRNFFEKYPEDDASCFLTSGRAFFEQEIVRDRLNWVRAHVKPVDVFENGLGYLYSQAIKGRNYILHADVAMGITISTPEPDWSSFTVIDQDSGMEVASYRNRIPPEDYAYHISQIGRVFNNATVSVELNPGGGGHSVLLTLMGELRYQNIFHYPRLLRGRKKENEKPVLQPGLPTDGRTRPIMLNKLALMLREHPELFLDEVFLSECLTFVRNPKGRPEAEQGCYDDTVMSRAGAHLVRLIQIGEVDPLLCPSEEYGEPVMA